MAEFKMLNPKSKSAMYTGHAIRYVILLLILYGIHWYVELHYPDSAGWVQYVFLAIALVTLAYILVAPPVYYNHYRYLITDEKIDIRRGILILRRTLVPIERLHQVEITRGPINNAFGLANIEVTTAGGIVTLEYLDHDEAERIAETLNNFIRSMIHNRGNLVDQ